MTSCLLNCEKEQKQNGRCALYRPSRARPKNVQIKYRQEMTPRSPKTVLTSPRICPMQVRVLNPRVRVRVQAESTSGETESASRENGTRVGLESEYYKSASSCRASVRSLDIINLYLRVP
jgi:hypothetical protein